MQGGLSCARQDGRALVIEPGRHLPLHLSSMQTWRAPLGFGALLCVVEHVQDAVGVQLEISFAHGSAQMGTWRMSEPSTPSMPLLLAGQLNPL